jgi:hypothetical protein
MPGPAVGTVVYCFLAFCAVEDSDDSTASSSGVVTSQLRSLTPKLANRRRPKPKRRQEVTSHAPASYSDHQTIAPTEASARSRLSMFQGRQLCITASMIRVSQPRFSGGGSSQAEQGVEAIATHPKNRKTGANSTCRAKENLCSTAGTFRSWLRS